MTDTKCTPGPWDDVITLGSVLKDGVACPIPVDETREDGESWLAMRRRTDADREARKAEQEANKLLQTESPALYAALDRLVALHVREQEGISSGMPTSEEWASAVDVAGYALAKARGES